MMTHRDVKILRGGDEGNQCLQPFKIYEDNRSIEAIRKAIPIHYSHVTGSHRKETLINA